jgi:hypothetical protein
MLHATSRPQVLLRKALLSTAGVMLTAAAIMMLGAVTYPTWFIIDGGTKTMNSVGSNVTLYFSLNGYCRDVTCGAIPFGSVSRCRSAVDVEARFRSVTAIIASGAICLAVAWGCSLLLLFSYLGTLDWIDDALLANEHRIAVAEQASARCKERRRCNRPSVFDVRSPVLRTGPQSLYVVTAISSALVTLFFSTGTGLYQSTFSSFLGCGASYCAVGLAPCGFGSAYACAVAGCVLCGCASALLGWFGVLEFKRLGDMRREIHSLLPRAEPYLEEPFENSEPFRSNPLRIVPLNPVPSRTLPTPQFSGDTWDYISEQHLFYTEDRRQVYNPRSQHYYCPPKGQTSDGPS